MYTKNKYVCELKKYSDDTLIRIAKYCGLIDNGLITVDRNHDDYIIISSSKDIDFVTDNQKHCRIISDFVMRDGLDKNHTKKYREIMTKMFKDYKSDYQSCIGNNEPYQYTINFEDALIK